jgi:replication fork protection complex subunit Csm3/Swi3
MLNMYQLWLDDLYPRAKLADGLAIIEKMGHKKRLQYMRKEWIQEGKPKNTVEADEEEDDGADGALDKPEQDQEQTEGDSFSNDARPDEQRNENTLRADIGAVGALEQEEPDEDELDALLAEDYATVNRPMTSTALPSRTIFEDDPFADDEAAMAEFEGT